MKIAYIEKKFSYKSERLIATANLIIEEYAAQGFALTLRQLYYQFVARAIIANTQQSYKRLGKIINDARLAGMIDWDAIVDRTRQIEQNSHWDDAGDAVRSMADQFKLDKWAGQEFRCEVWIEKQALIGIIEPVCRQLDIPYFACRGYVSQSEQWRAARRCYRAETKIIHLGDHDPSGIDMTRDNSERLKMFGGKTDVIRIALNMDQIEEFSPPPNPAKTTDSRYEGYIAEHGESSWELDALEPKVLTELIIVEVAKWRDDELFEERAVLEQEQIERLQELAEEA